MIKNYFLITFRSILKNKVFILINVFGMGIAIACCIVGYLGLEYDADFDAIHKNRDHVYRVSAIREFENKFTRFGKTALPLGEIVDKTFSDVNASSRYVHSWSNFKLEDELFAANLTYVDPEFFELFTFDFVSGSASALKDKTSVFISEDVSARLFHSPQEAIGKTMKQVYGTALKEVKIAGVFREPPMNSSFYKKGGEAFMNFENAKDEHATLRDDNWEKECTLFVQINDASRIKAAHQQLQAYIANNNKAREDFQVSEFTLDPFSTMAHRDRADETQAETWGAPPLSAITGSAIMAVLILLIACFNLTNTAIAISSRRLKEIGLRKVMGSKRSQLVIQFLSETTFICLIALFAGLAMGDLLIQGWNLITAGNIHITPHYTPSFLVFLLGVLLFAGVIAGSYPAFYISKFNPINILKGKVQFGSNSNFTRVLLGLQFAISLITIVSAIGFLQNANYQKNYDLGFDIRGSVIAWVNNKSEFETYRNALAENPNILSIAGASNGIFSTKIHEPVTYQSKQAEVDIIAVGDNYLKTMDLKLLAGRDFLKDSETDKKESIIVTQKMATLFGWSDPVGKEVIWKDSVKLFVVGVVKDVYTQGLWHELEPMMIRYVLPDQYSQMVVSTKAKNVASVNAFMSTQWNRTFPNRLYNGYMLSTNLQRVTDLGMSIVYGYGFLGSVALLLSVTGLFSLVSLNIVKRMKEIGVRKVLGASMANITRVINMEFIIILTVAAVLGSWAGFAWSSVIMGSIWKYYQGVNTLTIIFSVSVLFIVSFMVIGYKIFAVANMDPVKTLRDE
jgi:putative ABC transport system permease protein